MKIESIPCNFPHCNCPEPKLHIGAAAIGKRLRMRTRQVFGAKGLPVQRWGVRLVMRECAAIAFIEGRLK
jgi:hypothetical protein